MDDLRKHPREYNFVQAVRVIQQNRLKTLVPGARAQRSKSLLLGYDSHPDAEPVRFVASNTLNAEAADICSINRPAGKKESPAAEGRQTLEVSFTGLTGTLGALPHHYTSLILTRLRNKDTTLRDFLDLFNHRAISLFYRAWEKYRFPFVQERLETDSRESLFVQSLYSFAGMGLPALRNRQQLRDVFFLKYAALFAQQTRSAKSLQNMLCEYFRIPVRVTQFCGYWMTLAESSRTALPSRQNPLGRYNRLGKGIVLGTRVWDVQSKFRVRIGPIDAHELRGYLPDGNLMRPVCEATRCYAGSDFDFEVEIRVRNDTIEPVRLTAGTAAGFQLGRNSWLVSRPHERGTTSVVFQSDEV
jgi:type VI secretion system protein ImpH